MQPSKLAAAPVDARERVHERSGTRYTVLAEIDPGMPLVIGEITDSWGTYVVVQAGDILHHLGVGAGSERVRRAAAALRGTPGPPASP